MQGKLTKAAGAGLACAALLAGCGDMSIKKVWPFGNDSVQERPRGPANATEYQCAAGKRFYLRMMENGGAVWLILPERELRIDRLGGDGTARYGKGGVTLELAGNAATLRDGGTTPWNDCKTGVTEAAPAAK